MIMLRFVVIPSPLLFAELKVLSVKLLHCGIGLIRSVYNRMETIYKEREAKEERVFTSNFNDILLTTNVFYRKCSGST